MSESQDQSPDESPVGISDDLLPEDLQPGEDNPLADGLDDGETVDDLLDGGKDAEQLEDGSSDESSDGEPDSADD
jgi:hypothetical protein